MKPEWGSINTAARRILSWHARAGAALVWTHDACAHAGEPGIGRGILRALGCSVLIVAGCLAITPSRADDWRVESFVENDTNVRGRDEAGDTIGLARSINTFQTLFKNENVLDGWGVGAIIRMEYDAAPQLNSSEFGRDAGGPVMLGNTAGPQLAALGPILNPLGIPTSDYVPWGGGFPATFPFPAFNKTTNPNAGLQVLGQHWNRSNREGGFAFGVPVRPCNVDSRGCVHNYGGATLFDQQFPDFARNGRLDFIRELYVKRYFDLGGDQGLRVQLGRQQVVWGRSDLFRVLDVVNPVDYTRQIIYDNLEDIRYPQWIVQGTYMAGPGTGLSERDFQLVWNVDKFRPDNLGTCGQAYAPLDGACFFRGAKNIWDNGGTIANLVPAAGLVQALPTLLAADGVDLSAIQGILNKLPQLPLTGFFAADAPPHFRGIRNFNLPNWSLDNTQIGGRFEGRSEDGSIAFTLNALYYRSQLPILHAFEPYQIAFDLYFPRVKLIGGTADFNVDAIDTTVRFEGAYTQGEEFQDTSVPGLYSRHHVFRSVIGFDRATEIPFLNPNRTTLISLQFFTQHIFDFASTQEQHGQGGIPDFETNFIASLLLRTQYLQDTVAAQFITARDFRAQAQVFIPSLQWLYSNHLSFSIGANLKTPVNTDHYRFDDGRGLDGTGSSGYQSVEPLGFFRASIIGASWKENEVFTSIRYNF